MSKNLYKLLVNLPLFHDNSKRASVIYDAWCTQFPKLTNTMIFLAELENIEYEINPYPLVVDFKGISWDKGVKWLNDNGGKEDFFGAIITVETEALLEEFVAPNHIYKENIYRNDYFNSSTYCILEGDSSLTEKTNDFVTKVGKKNTMGILNLYEYPEKIKDLLKFKPKFLIIDSTLYNKEGIDKLLSVAKSIKYVPDKIYFLNEVVTIKYPYEKVEL